MIDGADAVGGFAGGCAVPLGGADVERVANDVVGGRVERGRSQAFGIAGEQGREGCVGIDAMAHAVRG